MFLQTPKSIQVDNTNVSATVSIDPATAGSTLVAIHSFSTNVTNRKIDPAFTERVVSPRSTFTGTIMATKTAVGGETSVRFGTDAVSNVNCFQELTVFELPGGGGFDKAAISEAAGVTSLSYGPTADLAAGQKVSIIGTRLVNPSGGFDPAPAGYAKVYDEATLGNTRMSISYKDDITTTTPESASQGWSTSGGGSGFIATFTYVPVVTSPPEWDYLNALPWVQGTVPPAELAKLQYPMFAKAMGAYVNNTVATGNRDQAVWDSVAKFYKFIHFEGHGWAKIIESDGTSQGDRFLNGRPNHLATMYCNGTYTTQGTPWAPFRWAAHSERHNPLGVAVFEPTTPISLASSITSTATTITINAPTDVPSGLPANHPSGNPSTNFWPLFASKGLTPSNETFSSATNTYVSWVRVGDEIIGLPPYSGSAYQRSGNVITINNVFRGLWRTARRAHSSGERLRLPDYVGSTGATQADRALSGNPSADSTGGLRYVMNFYDPDTTAAKGYKHDGLRPIADLVNMEQHGLDLNAMKTATSIGAKAINSTGHGLWNGARVAFGGSNIAPGIRSMTPYYVVNSSANAFEISETQGGPALEIGRPPTEWSFGTWVLHQLDNTAQFDANEAAISAVLADPGCVGFSMRMAWDDFLANPSLRQRGFDLAEAAGKKFMFRIMAGRHTPGQVFTDGAASYQSEGFTHPKPFLDTGEAGNPIFEAAYEAMVEEQVEWAKARGIRVFHAAWYGWKWSEFYNGADLIAAPGYSWPAALEGARRLIEIDTKYSGYDIAIEHSTSGHYEDPGYDEYTQMVQMVSDQVGNNYAGLITQGNNMNDQGNTLGKPAASLGLNHGKQSVSSTANTYNWDTIYDAAIANNYCYLEIYTAQWTGGTSATLRSRAASWLSGHTYTPPAVTDMKFARVRRDPGQTITNATHLDVSSVRPYNNGDGYGLDLWQTQQLSNLPYSFDDQTDTTLWRTRQELKAADLQQAIIDLGLPADHILTANNFLAQPSQVTEGERLNMIAGNHYGHYAIEHFAMEPGSLVSQITQACQFMAGVNSAGVVVNPNGHKVAIWIKTGDWKGGVFSNANGDQYIRLGYGMWLLTWRATATAPKLLVKSYVSSIGETPSDTGGREIFHWDFGVPATQDGGKPTNPVNESQIHQSTSGLYVRRYTKGVVLVNTTGFSKTWTSDATYSNANTEVNRSGSLATVSSGATVTVPAYDSVFLLQSTAPVSQYTVTRQSSPDRSEVALTSDPGTPVAVFTDGARTVRLPEGPERTFTQADLPIWDTFNRTRSDDWGITSPLDATWAATTWSELGGTTGPGGDYSVTGTAGRMSLSTVTTSRRATLHNMDASNTDVTTRVRFQHAPQGGSSEAGIILRYVDSDNYYYARVRLSHSSGTILVGSRKNVAGTLTAFGTEVDTGVVYTANAWLNLRADMVSNVMRIKVWADGASEPGAWTFTSPVDTTFTSGRAGVRANLQSGSTLSLPSYVEWDDFRASGTDASPTTVTHNTWVRLLDAPFNGTVDETWLDAALADTSPDVFAIGAQYLFSAPPVMDDTLQIAGPTDYSPLAADGTRDIGADWNDYLGITGVYPGYSDDPAEPAEFRCLDCSGWIRMIFGYRLGYQMTYAFNVEAGKLPRTSALQLTDGPGVVVIPDTGSKPALTGLEIGDLVFFDAYGASEIDHVGIYFGVDTTGSPRFISSRQTPNGPTFSDNGGNSTLDGTGTYANAFRAARRI